MRDRRELVVTWLVVLLAVGIFVGVCASNGIPAMRQDWRMPVTHAAEGPHFQAMYEGWLPYGIGYPNAYPTTFLLGFAGRLLAPLLSPWWLFVLSLCAVALLIVLSGLRLGAAADAPIAPRIAVALFALFNPWVYTKLVAGHLPMLAAYGAMIGIVAEVLRSRPRPLALVALAIVAMFQLQFAVFVGPAVAVWLILRREWVALATLALVAMPTIVGLVAYRGLVGSIPYLLVWQRDQSIAPLQAIVFGGYFAHYADAMLRIANIPMLFLCACVPFVATLEFRDRRVRALIVLTFIALLVATGTKSVLGPFYVFIVEHVPQSGVFRELFDLLAFAAVGYVLALALLGARMRFVSLVALPAALTLVAAWLVDPPSAYWTNASRIPLLDIAPVGYRYALFPAFVPLAFEGHGTGLDPDAAVRFLPPTPINKYIPYTPMFPVDVALAQYLLHGRTRTLGALGVSTIYERPYFESNTFALGLTISHAHTRLALLNRRVSGRRIAAIPLAALATRLSVASVANDLASTAVFAGDVPPALAPRLGLAHAVTVTPIAPPRVQTDPLSGWIDARLAFATEPDLGQAFGGAYTQSSRTTLQLSRAARVLLSIRGSLVASDGAWREHTTGGYRWVDVPAHVDSVRCFGACVVAVAGDVPTSIPANAPPSPLLALASKRLAPWLVRIDVPASAHEPLLRFNEAFSPYWIAYAPHHGLLTHVRIDAALNGYLDPPSGTIYCVQSVALVQLLLELAAALWCLICLSYQIAGRFRG